jgi:hypothetical protein
MRTKSLLAVALFVALGATACGSSSKSATGTSTSAPGSSGGSTSPSDSGSTTTIKLNGSGSSDFCDLARADDKAFSNFDPTSVSAADLKKQFENLAPALQQAADKAPSEIKGDFETFVNAFKPYLQALADANYDFSKINPTSVSGLESPAVQTASDHIEQYFEQVCHITTPST